MATPPFKYQPMFEKGKDTTVLLSSLPLLNLPLSNLLLLDLLSPKVFPLKKKTFFFFKTFS